MTLQRVTLIALGVEEFDAFSMGGKKAILGARSHYSLFAKIGFPGDAKYPLNLGISTAKYGGKA